MTQMIDMTSNLHSMTNNLNSVNSVNSLDSLNLLNFTAEGLIQLMTEWDEKSFRAQQIFKWIHKHGVDNFDQMSDLSKTLREKLKQTCAIKAPEIASEQISADGTIKWLLRLEDNNHIETVFIPEDDRGTLCVSSQVGCVLDCSFCSTGKQGFSRNLLLFEIIGQLWLAVRRLRSLNNTGSVTNIVMMGMGEPLLNFEAVVQALSIMRAENGYALPRRRVTVSTAGVVPKIEQLQKEADVSLAISLHAPNDELRNVLVPLNKKYPIQVLMNACKQYVGDDRRRHVTIEYVMLQGVNDSLLHARQLAKILMGLSCKVNLIPFNPHPGTEYLCPPLENIQAFRNVLVKAGYVTTTRKTRGADIDAACGQLVGRVQDKTSRSRRWKELKLKIVEENTWMEKTA